MTTDHHILETALHRFKTYGVSAVSMDDLAEVLGMAKSTLYQHFSSKDALVDAVMQHLTKQWDALITTVISEPINPIQKIIKLQYQGIQEIQQLSPVFLFDLKRRYEGCFTTYKDYKHHFVYEVMYQLLEDAKTQGMLLEHTDIQAVCELHFFQIERIVQERKKEVEPFSAIKLLEHLVLPNLRGIVKPEFVGEVCTCSP
jgi:AcrR family transcriptional regulator